MLALEKKRSLDALRERISGVVELSTLSAQGPRQSSVQTPSALLTVPGGLLQEVFADDRRNAGAGVGFVLGCALGLIRPERPVVLFVQLNHHAYDVGLPYSDGLRGFGFDPDRLILARVQTMQDLLWAMEEAICCRAVAAVVADIGGQPKALDFTASRRLSMRSASAGTSTFILRYGHEREATAAKLRWHVQPEPSLSPQFDQRAPGIPRWCITLEKGRVESGQTKFILDWTDNGFELAKQNHPAKGPWRPDAEATPSRLAPAALGYRLSQTG